jgi:hypothetical protein
MDYHDRHFQQAPITAITLCPPPKALPQLAEQLEQQTGIPVHEIKLEDIVQVHEAIDVKRFALHRPAVENQAPAPTGPGVRQKG